MAKRHYHESEIVFQKKPATSRFRDLEGISFNRLTVIGYAGKIGKNHAWWSRCECGNISRPCAHDITSGHTQSCGCSQKEIMREIRTSHGMTHHELYNTWCNMKRRCFSGSSEDYPRYGARGIKVCDGWKNDFAKFVADMGEKPFPEATIERVNNSLHYSCGHCAQCEENGWNFNCEWKTRLWQARNTRRNVNITLDGKTQCLSMWLEEKSLNLATIHRRVKKGMSWEEALTVPINVTNTGRTVEIDGETKTVRQWCEHFDTTRSTVYRRMKRGWSLHAAITTPAKKTCPRKRSHNNFK